MKVIAIALGGIVTLAAIVVGIGALLPVRHVASREARFERPPGEVWSVITDFAHAPEWRPDVKKVVAEGGAWRETDTHGNSILYETVEKVEPRRLVRKIASPELPFGGRWVFEIVPEGASSRLRITEEGEVYSPFYRFVSRFVLGHTATLDKYLSALGKRLAS